MGIGAHDEPHPVFQSPADEIRGKIQSLRVSVHLQKGPGFGCPTKNLVPINLVSGTLADKPSGGMAQNIYSLVLHCPQ
jgi:hypothetical protein